MAKIALTNLEVVRPLLIDNPKFASISGKSQQFFLNNAMPILNEAIQGGENAIFSVLMNRIANVAISELKLKNPLHMFQTSPLAFGAFMEEYGLHRVVEKKFRDKDDTSSQFDYIPSRVDRAIYKISRESQYSTSVEDRKVRQAFLDEHGLSTLLNAQISRLHKSNLADTYVLMRQMLTQYLYSGHVSESQVIPIPDLTDEDLDIQHIRKAIARLKVVAEDMGFNNTKYNPLGREQFTDVEDLVCLMDLEAFQQNEVQNLSQAFNTSYLDYKTPVIRVNGFEDDAVLAIMADKRAFGFHEMAPSIMTNSYEAKRLYTNYFYTVTEMYHASPFCNCVYFVKQSAYKDVIGRIQNVEKPAVSDESVLQ